jgi:hypothetical protein
MLVLCPPTATDRLMIDDFMAFLISEHGLHCVRPPSIARLAAAALLVRVGKDIFERCERDIIEIPRSLLKLAPDRSVYAQR